jgi:hypothetical protein
MTVSSTTVKNSYSGDGSNDTFVYGFKIFASSDLQVIIRSATGTETTKTLTTDYTVTGVGTASGGNVVFESTAIPTATETVVLIRNVPQTQAIDYIANDPFPAETHEEGLDRATMTIQQMQEEVTRSIKLSRTNTMTSTEFAVAAADRANKILAFDSTGEISVTQELGTYKGTDTTVTTAAYVQRDIVKSTSAAELNNVYICVANSVVGDLLTDTDHFDLLVDAVSAAASATAAASSATDAETAQTAAETAQTAAELAETNAATSESNAATSASAAAASADAFDDVYLGSKSSDPTTDNDGDPLAAGMLYYNTVSNLMRIYSGSAWENVAVSTAGFTTLTGVETLTNKTLTAPKIANGGFVADANGNEQIKFTTTASAVNELTVVNSAAGNAPEISSTGGDTDIDLKITPKGSGKIVLDGISFPNTDGTANQALVTDGSGVLSFASVTGRTGTVDWCTTAKTAPFTAVNGDGFFVNTTCGAVTVTLPSTPTAGDIVAFKDYAGQWNTNNVTLCNNGNKINGICATAKLSTQNQSVSLIYVDATKGWQDIQDSSAAVTGNAYITATGGTITNSPCGDYKIHTFTSDGCFAVTASTIPANNNVDYLVVAGGAGAGSTSGANSPGGGGAGGFRESHTVPISGCYTASPLASGTSLTVTTTTYPITVGGGGATGPCGPGSPGGGPGNAGSNSVFSTITSAGGGEPQGSYLPGNAGGSGAAGGGGTSVTATGGAGNTPPVSPPQGQPGGTGSGTSPDHQSGGGGGAGGAGTNASPSAAGTGGVGVSTSISGSSISYAGGGGGSGYACAVGAGLQGNGSPCGTGGQGVAASPFTADSGTANRGGGGGSASGSTPSGPNPATGGAGGSGIVIIRYRYQ